MFARARSKHAVQSHQPQTTLRSWLSCERLEDRTLPSGLVDQEVLNNEGFFARFGPHAPIFQSFKQVHDNITGASVRTHVDGVGTGSVTISLWSSQPGPGSVLLASGTDLNVTAGEWATVDFPLTQIIPEVTYFLQFSGSNGDMGVASTSRSFSQPDAYPRGQGYHNGRPITLNDVNFQTFYGSADIHMQSATLQSGNTVQFTYATTGNPGTFDVGLYRSADGITYNPTDLIATQTVTPSPTNPQTPGTFTLPNPWVPDPSKPYLVVVADPDNAITELHEDNNTASIALPDLVATTLDYRITHNGRTFTNNFIPVDSNVTVTTTIWNRGIGDAGAFKVTLYLSTDATIDPATDYMVTDFQTVTSLLPGATTQLSVTTTLPAALPEEYAGRVWLGVVVDSAHDMPESNEHNNFNQTTGDRRIVRMWDPLTTFSTLPVSFATLREAERYLRQHGFQSPVWYDIGWSLPVGPTFSRFNGKLMPAGAFRIQAIPEYNSITGRWVIQYEGPEPSPRTVLLYGFEWLIYVYQYHEVVD